MPYYYAVLLLTCLLLIIDWTAVQVTCVRSSSGQPCADTWAHLRIHDVAAAINKKNSKFFIAANMHNNELLIDDWFSELYRFILIMAPQQKQRSNIYVSVYDSGSTDGSHDALVIAQHRLRQLGVPNNIVIDGQVTADSIKDEHGQYHRIAVLARLRNEALAPLFGKEDIYKRVIFINDITFCAEGLIWLLLHGSESSDMMCATDFGPWPVRPTQSILYDTWVARDVAGMPLTPLWPGFTHHSPSRQLMELGEIIPMQCCWNGMVSINSAVFAAGVRFRHGGSFYAQTDTFTCSASEMTHFCDDMWSTGYWRIGMDPLVQTAYSKQQFSQLHHASQEWYSNLLRGRQRRLNSVNQWLLGVAANSDIVESHMTLLTPKQRKQLTLPEPHRVTALLRNNRQLVIDAALAGSQFDVSSNTYWDCCVARTSDMPAYHCCSIQHVPNTTKWFLNTDGKHPICNWTPYKIGDLAVP